MLVILLPACLSPLLMGEGFSVLLPSHPLCVSCLPFQISSVPLLDVKTEKLPAAFLIWVSAALANHLYIFVTFLVWVGEFKGYRHEWQKTDHHGIPGSHFACGYFGSGMKRLSVKEKSTY